MGFFSRSTPPDINKLKVTGNISGLIKALKYKGDSQVRKDAAAALKELTPQKKDQKKIAKYIVKVLSSDEREVVEDAIQAISTCDVELINYLESVYSNDLDKWKELTTLLSKINSDESLRLLGTILCNNRNFAVKNFAIHALNATRNPKAVDKLQYFIDSTEGLTSVKYIGYQLLDPVNKNLLNNWNRDDSKKMVFYRSDAMSIYFEKMKKEEKNIKNVDLILSTYRMICREAIAEILIGTQPTNIFKLWVKDSNPSKTYLTALLIKICKEDPDRVPKKFHEINEGTLSDGITINIKPNNKKGGSDVEFMIN